MTEKCFEHIRNLKLRTGCRPFTVMLSTFVFRNINGVIHQTHPFIGCLMLECVAVGFTVVGHKINDFRS